MALKHELDGPVYNSVKRINETKPNTAGVWVLRL